MIAATETSLIAETSFLPGVLQNRKRSLENKIGEVLKVINFDTFDLKNCVQNIFLNAETGHIVAENDAEKNRITKTALEQLQKLSETKWPLLFANLMNFKKKLTKRLSESNALICADSMGTLFLNDLGDFATKEGLHNWENEIIKTFDLLLERLGSLNENDHKISAIKEVIISFQNIWYKNEFLIGKLSLIDTKEKIIKRIRHHIKNKDPFIKVEEKLDEIVKLAEEALFAFPFEKVPDSSHWDVIYNTRDLLEEIDIEVEKEIALQEIEEKKKELDATMSKLSEREEIYSVSFESERKHIEFIREDSSSLISKIHKPSSPTGFNQTSQLFVAASGALSQLERSKSFIYITYGLTCIKKHIEFLKKFRTYENRNTSDIDLPLEKLLNNALEELTWGKEGEKSYLEKSQKGTHLGNVPPPILTIEEIDAIISSYRIKVRSIFFPK